MLKAFLLVFVLIASVILIPMFLWTVLGLKGTMWGTIFGLVIFAGLMGGGFLMWTILMNAFFKEK